MTRPLPNSYWVDPGRLLAGEHPAGRSLRETEQRIAGLVSAGLDCFIDLTAEGECADYRPALPVGTRSHRLPLVDHAAPTDEAAMRGILATLDAELREGRCVYLHCRAGIGRTGTTVACLLIERGASPHAALELLNGLWRQDARAPRWPRVPETIEQVDFVLGWRPAS